MISKHAVIGVDVAMGSNVHIGHFTEIHDNVIIGNGVVIGSHVVIKPYTVIGDGVFFDDYCISSGYCEIGDFSQIRYQSIIARNVSIGKHVFFCAGVKTAYLNHTGEPDTKQMRIEDEVFVGDNSTILSGLTVGYGTVIGAHSLLTHNALRENSIFVGCPAKYRRALSIDEISRRKQRLTVYTLQKGF